MAPSIAQARIIASGILLGLLWLPLPAKAGIDDCLQVALGTANPSELKKALAFATEHPTCLDNLVPPTLIPYIALSGSLDVANQSGVLNQVGLGFGNSYPQCVENMDPGKHAAKQLAPVLKPVCSTLNMNCNAFEGAAADEVNAQLVSEVPLLGMMPCACAAATSGLGVERIAELLKAGQKCGATLEQLADAIGETGEALYHAGGYLLEGAGDLASSLGCTIFGCAEQKPPPMPARDYYVLYLQPTTHFMLMAKEAEDGSYKQKMGDFNKGCGDFYLANYDTDNGACTSNLIKLGKTVDVVGKALKDSGQIFYAVHVEPELGDWSFRHFGQDSSGWVAEKLTQCRAAVSEAIPMPDPKARCQIMADSYSAFAKSGFTVSTDIEAKLAQQCAVEQQPYVVNAPHDIYEVACEPVAKKTPVAVLAAMNDWKQAMNKAEAAGCTNNGTPGSIQCPGFEAFVACRNALKDKASLCGGDAETRLTQGVAERLNGDSAKAGKPARCQLKQGDVQCSRPLKQQLCKTYMAQYGDLIGIQGAQARCTFVEDPEYMQLRQQAAQAAALLNGDNPSSATHAGATTAAQPVQSSGMLKLQGLLTQALAQQVRAVAATQCHVEAPDWLRIRCPSGFVWDAEPARAQAVTALLGAPLALCPSDVESDGADLPCLDGMAVGAFPEQAKPEDKPAEPALLEIKPIRF